MCPVKKLPWSHNVFWKKSVQTGLWSSTNTVMYPVSIRNDREMSVNIGFLSYCLEEEKLFIHICALQNITVILNLKVMSREIFFFWQVRIKILKFWIRKVLVVVSTALQIDWFHFQIFWNLHIVPLQRKTSNINSGSIIWCPGIVHQTALVAEKCLWNILEYAQAKEVLGTSSAESE